MTQTVRAAVRISGVLAFAVSFAACGSSSPTTPASATTVVVLTAQYVFACGSWAPASPPALRAYFDVILAEDTGDAAPSPALLASLAAAGGAVSYTFHGPMVRVALNISSVPALSTSHVITWARGVTDLSAYPITLDITLDHHPADSDLQIATRLGGTVQSSGLPTSTVFSVTIDDSKVPQLIATLPGFVRKSVDAVGLVCAS